VTSSVSAILTGMIPFHVITVRSRATGSCVVFMMHTDGQALETLLHVHPYLSGRKYHFKPPVHVSFCNNALPKAFKIINACFCDSHVCLTADRRESL
jgi:hypothetical protein